VTRETIVAELAQKLELDHLEAARLARLVASSLIDFVSVEEITDLLAQLPADLKQLFPEA
jgi:uncharacterized protein (DUF2267 family)